MRVLTERDLLHLVEGKTDLLVCFRARKVLDDDTFHLTILPVSAIEVVDYGYPTRERV